MRWTRKDLADYIGVTKKGVDFFEKNGFVHSTSDPDNNYKYYGNNDFIVLAVSEPYKRVGFSLEERKELIESNPDEADLLFKQRIKDEEAAHEKKMQILLQLRANIQEIRAGLDKFQIIGMPDLCWINDSGEETNEMLSKEYNYEISEWIKLMPVTFYGIHYTYTNDEYHFDRCIMAPSDKLPDELKNSNYAHTLISGPYLTTIFAQYSDDEDVSLIEPLIRYAAENHVDIGGDPFGMVLYTEEEKGKIKVYTKVCAPVAGNA